MIYHNEILCVSGTELIKTKINPSGLISKGVWDKWIRGGAKVVRRASFRKSSLIDFNTIPIKYRKAISEKYNFKPQPTAPKTFKDCIIIDEKTTLYYKSYLLANGLNLPEISQNEYQLNASVLNAIKGIKDNATISRKALGGSMQGFWGKVSIAVNNIRIDVKHTLPSSEIALKRKFIMYVNEGYEGLISKKYCNNNSLKK